MNDDKEGPRIDLSELRDNLGIEPPEVVKGPTSAGSFPKEWVAPIPSAYVEPYPEDAWADNVDKQIKQLRLGVAASFALAGLAIGMAGLLGKAVNSLMQGLNQLAENQNQFVLKSGQAIPMPPAPAQAQPGPTHSVRPVVEYVEPARESAVNTEATPVPANTAPKDRSLPDPTIDPNAPVAEPASGPGGEASQRVKDLLAQDGALSMKDSLPDALAVPEAAVNPEAKHADVRHVQ